MSAQKGLFDSPEAEAKSEARADADVEASRLISHDAVRRWLSSWGSTKRLPKPRVGDRFAQDRLDRRGDRAS